MQRVVHAILALLHFHFGAATDADDGDAAGQLGQTFLQFLAIIVGSGFLNVLSCVGTW